jgi:hypothetical protein
MLGPNLSTETFPKSDPAILKLGAEVRRLMTEAMKRAGKNAKEVAKEMTDRLGGRPITESMIYELTRNGSQDQPREVRLLATWVPAFCEVTGDDRLQRWLAGPRLREFIELGQGVCSIRADGERLLRIASELKALGRQKKGKVKPTQKA